LADGDTDDFVDGIRESPVEAGFEQLFGTGSAWHAEAEDDGDFVGVDGEHAGAEEDGYECRHEDFDDAEAATERFGQRLGAGIFDGFWGERRGLRPGWRGGSGAELELRERGIRILSHGAA